MDIWAWVTKLQEDLAEAGQHSSAQLIDDFVEASYETEIARAQSLAPEAKALAKTLKNPWLEIFVGHWEMRNRLGNISEGESALSDVVSLFELAHRPEYIDCPQSVCVTQDLSNCYANIDGPGWAPERIAVCEETLARIDPSWNCYTCLSLEKIDALLSSKRYDDASDFLQKSKALVEASDRNNQTATTLNFNEYYAKLLLNMGRNEEVITLFNQDEPELIKSQSESERQLRYIQVALAFARLGRHTEALEKLPEWELIMPGRSAPWLRVSALLAQQLPDRNTWQFGVQTQLIVLHFDRVQAHRDVINTVKLSIPLALARGGFWFARAQLEIAQRHLSKLRQDLGASAELAQLTQSIDTAASTACALPVPANEFARWLEQLGTEKPRSPEQETQWLLQAIAEQPDDQDLYRYAANAMKACAVPDKAIGLLYKYIDTHPHERNACGHYLVDLLLARNQPENVQLLGKQFRKNNAPVMALWCDIKYAETQQQWPEVEKLCRQSLEIEPESEHVFDLLIDSLTSQERFAETAQELEARCDKNYDPNDLSYLFKHVSIATIAQDWEAVRRSCRKLGIPVNNEQGPIDEDWGSVKIRFNNNGEEVFCQAIRTGPATARITQLLPEEPQRLNDLIVFYSKPLEAQSQDESEPKDNTPAFGYMDTIKDGNVGPGWYVYGVFPGEEEFGKLTNLAQSKGFFVQRPDNLDYSIQDPEDNNKKLPGICFLIAAPMERKPEELHDFLASACSRWKHPWMWPDLILACDFPDDCIKSHYALCERYGLLESSGSDGND
jgi:tetratricopeptide (TPR) repeat protein